MSELETWEKHPCILEVDLEYPKSLHDLHSDYPLAPEQIEVNKVNKLIPNLCNKKKYCIKPTLSVRYKHVLTGENRALRGENVYKSVNSRAVNDWLCMFNILDPGLPCKQCMLNVCPCQFQVLQPTWL